MGEVLNEYLQDKAEAPQQKTAEGFFKKLSAEWELTYQNISKTINLHNDFINIFLRDGKKMIVSSIVKFSDSCGNDNFPDTKDRKYLFNNGDFLEFNSLVNGNRNIGVFDIIDQDKKNHTIFGPKAIVKKYQEEAAGAKTIQDRENIGHKAYKDIVDYYGFGQNMMVEIVGEGSGGLYHKYYDGEAKFNNISMLADPSRARAIASGIFKHDETLANEFGNLLVGIKKFYPPDELYNALINREVDFGTAIFIARYQAGETRGETGKKLYAEAAGGHTAENIAEIELTGRSPHEFAVIERFANLYLGVDRGKLSDEEYKEKIGKINDIKTATLNSSDYDFTVISKMKRGLSQFITGEALSEKKAYTVMEGGGKLQSDRNIADATVGFYHKYFIKLKTTGILPDHINQENKYDHLIPLATTLGLPEVDKKAFADVVYNWSVAIKQKDADKPPEKPGTAMKKIKKDKAVNENVEIFNDIEVF